MRNLETKVEVLLASFAINLLALPLAMLQVYDRILGNSGWGTAVALLGWVAVAIVLEVFCRFGRSLLLANRAAEFELNAQIAGLHRLLRTDFRAIEAKGSSRLPALLEAPAKLQDLYSGQGYVALYDLPFAIIFLGLVFYIGGSLALIPLSVFVVVVIFAAVSGADFPAQTERFERLDASRNWMLSRYFGAMEGVRAMGMESLLTGIVRCVTRARMDLQEAMERKSLMLTEASMFLGQVTIVLIIGFGCLRVLKGELTVGGSPGSILKVTPESAASLSESNRMLTCENSIEGISSPRGCTIPGSETSAGACASAFICFQEIIICPSRLQEIITVCGAASTRQMSSIVAISPPGVSARCSTKSMPKAIVTKAVNPVQPCASAWSKPLRVAWVRIASAETSAYSRKRWFQPEISPAMRSEAIELHAL
jgi:ABC-type multidrug transport system fused ATPase/permease subunit